MPQRKRVRPDLLILEDRLNPATIYGLTPADQLIIFDSANPGVINQTVTLTGLLNGEVVRAIDFRPATGQLYGIGVNDVSARLLKINTITGAVTPVGLALTVAGTNFDLAFNPTADTARVTDDGNDNLAIDPDTGAVTPLTELNGTTPNVVGAAFTNNYAGAASTNLYVIDGAKGLLENETTLGSGGLTPVGSLGAVAGSEVGFDISANDGRAFASLTSGNASRLFQVNLSTGAATQIAAIGSVPTVVRDIAVQARAVTVYATNGSSLITFNSATPGTFSAQTSVTGLRAGETLVGIDFRPATGQLYGLGSGGRLYLVNSANGQATQVGSGTFAVALAGTRFGFNFDPVNDVARVVSDAGQNFRLDPNTGAVIDGDANTAGVQPDAPLNFGGTGGSVVAIGYDNSFTGATASSLFGIDSTNGNFVRIGAAGNSASASTGAVATVGSLNLNVINAALDVSAVDGSALAAITFPGIAGNVTELAVIDRAKGAVNFVSTIGDGATAVTGLAAAPEGTISGTVFVDANGNGAFDAGETGLAGATVTVDEFNDGTQLIAAQTDANGHYQIGVSDGAHAVALTVPDGYTAASATSLSVAVSNGSAITGKDFGVRVPAAPVARLTAVGEGPGGEPRVNVFNPDGSLRFTFDAYDPSFKGGVTVATGDVTGDGTPDIIVAPGPGGGPHVQVFDGRTGVRMRSFFAYGANFGGGVFVAAADFNHDGHADIVTGAGIGGGPHVEVFDGVTGAVLQSFFAYDPTFRGGVFVAAGDINGDGTPDIATGTGAGGAPHVKAFDGVTGATIASFYAYDPNFIGGVTVAVGDVTRDGKAEIITGAGAGGGPHVKAFAIEDGLPTQVRSFFAYSPQFAGGVRVSAEDYDGDGVADFAVAAGLGGGPHVRVFSGATGDVLASFYAFDAAFTRGIFIG